jgi:hypothetical protein
MSDLKFSHSGAGAPHNSRMDAGSVGGLAAFHTFENEKDEIRSSSKIVAGVAVAVMIAGAIAYGYETVNAPSPVKPVAASALPHSVATTPPVAPNAAMSNPVTPPAVPQQDAVPVAPRPAPVHKQAKAEHSAPVHKASVHKAHPAKAVPADSAVQQRMAQPSGTPAPVVPQQQPLIPDTTSPAPADNATPMTPAPAQTAPAQAMPQNAPQPQTPVQPQSAPMQ